MSRSVIRDVVIPIVSRILQGRGYSMRYMSPTVEDPRLEEYLEEMMRRHFGVIGANDCQHLREQLEEAKRNDPYEFQLLVERLLRKYAKLIVELRTATSKAESGPPDRFLEMRRQYRLANTRSAGPFDHTA